MAKYGTRRLPAIAIVCVLTAASAGVFSGRAQAFDLKHDAHGQPLHWPGSKVTYVVDPSVEETIRGGARAVASAVEVWNGTTGAAGAPALTTVAGAEGALPGLDGKNAILLAPHGFAPAGNALAVTITSYDEATGEIVDADIVINGIHKFGVLPPGARPNENAPRVPTDGSSGDAVDTRHMASFDVNHVVAHEIGHTLGLADERTDDSALMYAFTMPGDASIRTPSFDDAGGVKALYGMSAHGQVPASGQGGCGQASVAGARARPEDTWDALALLVVAGMWLVSRRRANVAAGQRRYRVVRLAIPVAAALVTLVASPGAARSAEDAVAPTPSVVASVVDVSTTNVGGLFETTMRLAPTACAEEPCPVANLHAWGGTVGGITQRVGGALVPTVGDQVTIRFTQGAVAVLVERY